MNKENQPIETVKIFFPDYELLEPFFDFILFYLLFTHVVTTTNRVAPNVDNSTGSTLFAVVLWLFLGRAIYKLYENQWRPNPRSFESPDAVRAFLTDQTPATIGWLWNGAQIIIGGTVLILSWEHFTRRAALFLLGIPNIGTAFFQFALWLAAFLLGWRLVSTAVDNVVVNYWRNHIAQDWIDATTIPSSTGTDDGVLSSMLSDFRQGYREVQEELDDK